MRREMRPSTFSTVGIITTEHAGEKNSPAFVTGCLQRENDWQVPVHHISEENSKGNSPGMHINYEQNLADKDASAGSTCPGQQRQNSETEQTMQYSSLHLRVISAQYLQQTQQERALTSHPPRFIHTLLA
eukprot:scaffold170143_cov19-Tisochrysis_lutea.AAC.2